MNSTQISIYKIPIMCYNKAYATHFEGSAENEV